MADKLSLYNAALRELGERRLASLTENRESRRVLDDMYAQEVAYCLGEGFWAFMTRTVDIDASTTAIPQFGFLFAFLLPTDYVRTVTASSSQTLTPPFMDNDAVVESGYIYTNWTPIFLQYVSNDVQFGMNLGVWPAYFTDFVAKRLARQSCVAITGNRGLLTGDEGLIKVERQARLNARSKDAMNLPVKFAPTQTWVRARRGFMHRMPGPGDEPGGTLLG